MSYTICTAELIRYLRENEWLTVNGFLPRYHAVLCDPPYFLGSIVKRFGKANSAPAAFGKDGRLARLSKGFMGQTWDGFEDMADFQAWCAEWGRLLLSYVYPGAVGMFFGGTRTYHRLACGLEDAGWEIYDTFAYMYGSGFPKSHDVGKSTADSRWQGYGTALKPAWEPVIVARAPRAGNTFATLAREYGSGALNIDGGRIAGINDTERIAGLSALGQTLGWNDHANKVMQTGGNDLGRWPSNVIMAHSETCTPTECADDCPIRILDRQSGKLSSGARNGEYTMSGYAEGWGDKTRKLESSSGGASRFLYTAKAASWEREAGLEGFETQRFAQGNGAKAAISRGENEYLQQGHTGLNVIKVRRNVHPTVKPIEITEYLARLLCPPPLDTPRRLLVPFAGSGSEMIGAHFAGWDEIVGIEQSAEYAAIAEARLRWWTAFPTYASAERAAVPAGRETPSGQLRMFKEP